MKPSPVRKKNQVSVHFIIINRLNDPLIRIHSVSGIMWLHFMHYYCLKWFQFYGNLCWW